MLCQLWVSIRNIFSNHMLILLFYIQHSFGFAHIFILFKVSFLCQHKVLHCGPPNDVFSNCFVCKTPSIYIYFEKYLLWLQNFGLLVIFFKAFEYATPLISGFLCFSICLSSYFFYQSFSVCFYEFPFVLWLCRSLL